MRRLSSDAFQVSSTRVGENTDTTTSSTMRGSERGVGAEMFAALPLRRVLPLTPALSPLRGEGDNVQICCSRGLLGQFSSNARPNSGANINCRARLPDESGSCEALSFVH